MNVTNINAKRTYRVSNCKGLSLWHNPKTRKWTFKGGKYGEHVIYAPNCYNERVDAHWIGYIKNNALDPHDATFKTYEN